MHRLISLLLILFALFALAPAAAAAQTGRDMKKEAVIWNDLHAMSPELVEVFKEATTKMDNRDYKGAADLFQKVVDAKPQFDPALRRLGSCRAQSGDLSGIKLIEQAVELNRSSENLASLARSLMLSTPGGKASKDDLGRAFALIEEASRKEPEPDPDYGALIAQIALSLENETAFRAATASLVRDFPNSVYSHYYNALRATMDESWTEAEDEIKRAEELGLPHEAAEQLLSVGVRSRATVWRYAYYSLGLLVAWAGGLVLLFVSGKLLSKHTLNSIERNADSVSGGKDQTLRKAYSRLIDVASVYYYVSLPFVIFVLLTVAGSVGYAFLMLGRIPIKLMLFLVIGTLVTIYKMVHSLFVKVKSDDPGRALKRDEAPALWDLTTEVAHDIGTRPIQEIRITSGTELAVYERGTRREKAQDKARRILILGVGVLDGFRTMPFRAVLAHEYGHFAHRDTAGGASALRARNDMMKFAFAMARAGQATWWNLGFQFVRLYYFLFTRITHGASRLQEVMADRMAALHYGADAFEAGLRHAIRRSVVFTTLANQEIESAINAKRPIHNLYALAPPSGSSLDAEVEKAINQPTSENDTHPSAADRFRLVHGIQSRERMAYEDALVWDFFANKEALAHEMHMSIVESISR